MTSQTKDDLHFTRKMDGRERMRLYFPNMNVVVAARVAGSLDPQALQGAVDRLRRRHPLLGARIRLDDDQAGWFTTAGTPEIRIDCRPRPSDMAWLATAESELRMGWPLFQGPLIRFVLLHAPEGSDLIINAHHSICDGRSLVKLVSEILAEVTVPTPEAEIQTITPHSAAGFLPPPGLSDRIYNFFIGRMNRRWRRKGLAFSEDDYRDLHQGFWEANQATIHTWALTEAQTAALVDRSRQAGVTVNSTLYTAFLKAQTQVRGQGPEGRSNVLVPVDLRSWLDGSLEGAFGFYASAVVLDYPFNLEDDFWPAARRFNDQVQSQLTAKNVLASSRVNSLDPSLLDGMVFAANGALDDEMAADLARRILDKMRTGLMISNLGRLEIPQTYGPLQLEALWPPAVYSRNVQIALEVLTFAGRAHLTLTHGQAFVPEATVAEIRARAMTTLGEAVGW